MDWKKTLYDLERHKQWDAAIELMEKVVSEKSNDVEAYLGILYLLMNLLVEEDYDESKYNYYAMLIKQYFDEAYARFSDNPEFLFFAGHIAYMSEWYFGIEQKDAKAMLYKAMELDPKNVLYQWTQYIYLDKNIADYKQLTAKYAASVLYENSYIQKILKSKGSMGENLLGVMINWSQDFIE